MLTIQELLKKKADFNKYLANKMKDMKNLSIPEKKTLGQQLNQEKQQFYYDFKKQKENIEQLEINRKLEKNKIDVTMPGRKNKLGSINLITKSMNDLLSICKSLGFDIYDGPSVDSDWYNFEALNFPKDHPARSMHDTFFVDNKYILRTHTSNMQIRVMEENKPPLKFISIGRVYRKDSDATHLPMFHQMEGMVVDNEVNVIKLKLMLRHILERFFERKIEMRFRNSYFPFTSPSFEVDIYINGKWLEVLGSGIVHENVFKNCGINRISSKQTNKKIDEQTDEKFNNKVNGKVDQNTNGQDDNRTKVKGYAFGCGIERLAMIKYDLNDLRLLFSGDQRFLNKINIKNF